MPHRESRHFHSTDEIDRATRKLERRIQDLQLLQADHVRYDDVRVVSVGRDVRETIRDVFGKDSPEFEEYSSFRIDFIGSINTSPGFAQVQLERSLPRAIAKVESLINRLLAKREDVSTLAAALSASLKGRLFHAAIVDAARDLYLGGHYPQAVFEASKVLIHLVKEKSGRTTLEGADLMRAVFSRNDPVLAFNGLTDQSDQDEQEGMMHLFEGAVMSIRNPDGHGAGVTERPDRAIQQLQLLGLLADRLEDATRRK
jgi:uncharacterized protein (TIGR02391 family)